MILSIVLLVLAFNFFIAHNIFLAIGSLLGSILFIVLMVKNVLHVKRLKEKKETV